MAEDLTWVEGAVGIRELEFTLHFEKAYRWAAASVHDKNELLWNLLEYSRAHLGTPPQVRIGQVWLSLTEAHLDRQQRQKKKQYRSFHRTIPPFQSCIQKFSASPSVGATRERNPPSCNGTRILASNVKRFDGAKRPPMDMLKTLSLD